MKRVAFNEEQALNALLTDERTEVAALAPIYGVLAPSQRFRTAGSVEREAALTRVAQANFRVKITSRMRPLGAAP